MSPSRRQFLASSVALAAGQGTPVAQTRPGISLAAWSFSGSFFEGGWKLLELPAVLRNKLGIEGLEYVNQFFENPTLEYLQKLKRACSDNGVRSLLLMVDNEGATAAADPAERREAAIAHRKWIDIAQYLGCHSVRCNMRGGADDWKQDRTLVDRAAETFHAMLDYAKGSGLNILVENHGRASSDPDLLMALVKKVDDPKFGLLCDLGNWNHGDDRYAAVRKTIPYARALSVKGTYGANVDPAYDMDKLLRVALEGGYSGWWAIEVTPRNEGVKLPAAGRFDAEVVTVREVKSIVERVVFHKA
jgi:L-ribulose-5-phosphate 3-epimerase